MENELTINYQLIKDIVYGDSKIDDPSLIEDLIILINKLEKKVDFYKDLKDKRVKAIAAEMKKEEDKINSIKEKIKKYMEESKDKKLLFPGIGSVSASNKNGKWIIKDEEEIKKIIKEFGKEDSIIKKEEKINKNELNKLLDSLEKNKNVPNCAEREPKSLSISVKYEKAIKENKSLDDDEEVAEENSSVEKRQINNDKEEFDGIDF